MPDKFFNYVGVRTPFGKRVHAVWTSGYADSRILCGVIYKDFARVAKDQPITCKRCWKEVSQFHQYGSERE